MVSPNSATATSMPLTQNRLSEVIATVVWSDVSGWSLVFEAIGRFRDTPCCTRGAMSITMMSSTSMTSTSGVTLISDWILVSPLLPTICIDITKTPYLSGGLKASGYQLPTADYEVFLMK